MLQKYNMIKAAGIFFDEPAKTHYLREICKKSGISPVSILKYLDELIKNKIIIKNYENKGKRKYPIYSSNMGSEEYLSFKKVINIINIYNSGIIKKLNDNLMPSAIILFGSYFRGEDTEESDIDLYIQAQKREINVSVYEKKLNRKIQLIFNKDFNSYSPELKNNIINGLVLKGYLEAF
jgi:predicted nucleotidyltransferase